MSFYADRSWHFHLRFMWKVKLNHNRKLILGCNLHKQCNTFDTRKWFCFMLSHFAMTNNSTNLKIASFQRCIPCLSTFKYYVIKLRILNLHSYQIEEAVNHLIESASHFSLSSLLITNTQQLFGCQCPFAKHNVMQKLCFQTWLNYPPKTEAVNIHDYFL